MTIDDAFKEAMYRIKHISDEDFEALLNKYGHYPEHLQKSLVLMYHSLENTDSDVLLNEFLEIEKTCDPNGIRIDDFIASLPINQDKHNETRK